MNRPASAAEYGGMTEEQKAAYDAGRPFSYAEDVGLAEVTADPMEGAYIVQRPGAALRDRLLRVIDRERELL